jgi:hypothetical protein
MTFHAVIYKVLTYIEYRAVSGVFRTIGPQPPLHPASVSTPPPPHQKGGYTLAVRWGGGGGVNISVSEDATHWIGLLQNSPSTPLSFSSSCNGVKLTCRFLFRAEGTEEFRPITNPGPASLPRLREVAVLTRNKNRLKYQAKFKNKKHQRSHTFSLFLALISLSIWK